MTPTPEQLDHLIGHTANRALSPDEHALLRAGVQRLRAALADALSTALGIALNHIPDGPLPTVLTVTPGVGRTPWGVIVPTPATCGPACSEAHTYNNGCQLAPNAR
ncbi:hypothetical protein ACIRRH_41200 [Kitasatospora sp. NPDC101235]|uniref:hypothetical protein n=1 Tax=Kitasatospora sp. NPDC101235 TaxID=3364101 RepID=UPI003825CB7C